MGREELNTSECKLKALVNVIDEMNTSASKLENYEVEYLEDLSRISKNDIANIHQLKRWHKYEIKNLERISSCATDNIQLLDSIKVYYR